MNTAKPFVSKRKEGDLNLERHSNVIKNIESILGMPIREYIHKYGPGEWSFLEFRRWNLVQLGIPEGLIPLFLIQGDTHCNFEHDDATDLI